MSFSNFDSLAAAQATQTPMIHMMRDKLSCLLPECNLEVAYAFTSAGSRARALSTGTTEVTVTMVDSRPKSQSYAVQAAQTFAARPLAELTASLASRMPELALTGVSTPVVTSVLISTFDLAPSPPPPSPAPPPPPPPSPPPIAGVHCGCTSYQDGAADFNFAAATCVKTEAKDKRICKPLRESGCGSDGFLCMPQGLLNPATTSAACVDKKSKCSQKVMKKPRKCKKKKFRKKCKASCAVVGYVHKSCNAGR